MDNKKIYRRGLGKTYANSIILNIQYLRTLLTSATQDTPEYFNICSELGVNKTALAHRLGYKVLPKNFI